MLSRTLLFIFAIFACRHEDSIEFPYVFKEDKIIPPYIDPKFYDILF